jgi:methyl-accepting chemotaxis protein
VRKLAERTASATVEIAQMINSVMSQTEVAIGHTSKTNERVATGVAMSREAADKVGKIKASTHIAGRMSEITSSTKEQSTATTVMAQSAERINAKALESDENVQRILTIIQDLSRRGGDLRNAGVAVQAVSAQHAGAVVPKNKAPGAGGFGLPASGR